MAAATAERRRKQMKLAAVVVGCATAVVVVGWTAVAVSGWMNWEKEALGLRGTFGDSFGVLSALFTGLAMIGAAIAIYLQREQLIEQRDEIRDNKRRGDEDAVETRFFQLIAALQNAVNGTRVGEEGGGYVGRQAIRKIAYTLTYEQRGNRTKRHAGPNLPLNERRQDIDQWFTTFYKGVFDADGKEKVPPWGDLVGYIFRLIYHILKFIEANEGVGGTSAEFYVKILRAQLSNPELVLLFYNCLSHYGYEDHFPLVEKYEMLKNINVDSLADKDDALLYQKALGQGG
jgi:uncharacterized membrane protein